MAYLALVRHGESEWNARDIWTGWTDIPLSEKGRQEARGAAEQLRGIAWDIIFQSALVRAKQTTEEITAVLGLAAVPVVSSPALNERDYGDFTGKNKFEIEKLVGPERFLQIRRGWDVPVPHGETLKDVYSRTIPYYEQEILPKLKEGKNVLISAHGNSLRALVKYLDGLSDEDVTSLELATGEVDIYQISGDGKVVGKEIKKPI